MEQHSSLVQAMKFDQSNRSATEQFYVIDGLCDAILVLEQTGKAIPEMVSMNLMHKCAHTDICVTTSSKQAQAVNTSPLLHFIEQTFLRITSNANVTGRVMVMGTHDTMIAFLLQSLNAFDRSTTPSYGSSIVGTYKIGRLYRPNRSYRLYLRSHRSQRVEIFANQLDN